MVLDQTLALAKNIDFCTPRSPLIPSLSPNPLPPVRILCSPAIVKRNRRLSIHGGVKCWTDNNNNKTGRSNGSVAPQYPRPSEIPWSEDIWNCVQLIGLVDSPVETMQLESGEFLALIRLLLKKPNMDTFWIKLALWDDLAHSAAQHVEHGQQIYVSGQLLSDPVVTEDGEKHIYHKVNVNQLHFIETKFSSAAGSVTGRKVMNNIGNDKEQLWRAFFANPANWWDNRKNKRNPKAPDFRHKDTGESLWIQGWSTPPWVETHLEILDTRM